MSITRKEDLVASKCAEQRKEIGGIRAEDVEQLKQMQQDMRKAQEAGMPISEDRRTVGDRRIKLQSLAINNRYAPRRESDKPIAHRNHKKVFDKLRELTAKQKMEKCEKEPKASFARIAGEALGQMNTGIEKTLTGGSSTHYKLHVAHPKTFAPYNAECEDLILALAMTFEEGEAFKAIWRKAAARLGNGKPGSKDLYDAEKVAHFGESMVLVAKHAPSSKIKNFKV